MSWIKDNQFAATLGGITLVGAAALVFAGLQGSGRYNEAKASYDEATGLVIESEGLPLYPTEENARGKKKAVTDYREAVGNLQNAFGKFRPEATPNIAPQEFTNRLQSARNDVVKAFEGSKATVPGNFFLGFEGYASGTLARQDATGILDYQLGAAREALEALGKAGVSSLINVHRPRLAEEDGGTWKGSAPDGKPAPADAARPLSFEVVFKGSEQSARNFFTSLAKSEKYYYVVRSVRLSNERKTAPVRTDAKFEAAPVSEPAPEDAAPQDQGFALPGDPAPAPAADGAPAPAPEEAAAPAPAPLDTGRVLSQVLGAEDVYVFVRFDVMQFLPAKPLPQP